MLRRAAPDVAHALVLAVVDAVVGITRAKLGVDAQLSDWVWMDDEPWQLDLTTPFLLEDGHLAFDLSPFLAALPAVVRPLTPLQSATGGSGPDALVHCCSGLEERHPYPLVMLARDRGFVCGPGCLDVTLDSN